MVRSVLIALTGKECRPHRPGLSLRTSSIPNQRAYCAGFRSDAARISIFIVPGGSPRSSASRRVLGEEPLGQVVHEGDEAETGMLYVFPSEYGERIAERERVRPRPPPNRELPHGRVCPGRADGARPVEPVYLVKPLAVVTGIDRPAVQGRLARNLAQCGLDHAPPDSVYFERRLVPGFELVSLPDVVPEGFERKRFGFDQGLAGNAKIREPGARGCEAGTGFGKYH